MMGEKGGNPLRRGAANLGLGAGLCPWTMPVAFNGNAEVTEPMADPLSTDDGEEQSGTKPDFIGKVVDSAMEHEDFPQNDEWEDPDHPTVALLYEIQPLNKPEWKNQYESYVRVNNNFQSKWMLVIGHLQHIHGNLKEQGIEGVDDLLEFLKGRVYKFREIDFSEDEEFTYPGTDTTVVFNQMFRGGENDVGPLMVPAEEVTDEDTLMDLGADQTKDGDEVDEVSL